MKYLSKIKSSYLMRERGNAIPEYVLLLMLVAVIGTPALTELGRETAIQPIIIGGALGGDVTPLAPLVCDMSTPACMCELMPEDATCCFAPPPGGPGEI